MDVHRILGTNRSEILDGDRSSRAALAQTITKLSVDQDPVRTNTVLPGWVQSDMQNIVNYKDWVPRKNTYYVGKSKDFVTIDACLTGEDTAFLIQVTTRSVHKINGRGLLDALKCLKHFKYVFFLFVVPSTEKITRAQAIDLNDDDKVEFDEAMEKISRYSLHFQHRAVLGRVTLSCISSAPSVLSTKTPTPI
jgi:hypothetical protein